MLAEIDELAAQIDAADVTRYERNVLDADRHERITARLSARLGGLRARLRNLPLPTVDISPLLDPELLADSWDAAPLQERRALLRLA
jgi:hypothetical protein